MVFKLIKFVPWALQETDEEEPRFLPTRYPLCFLGKEYTMGIGFGYRTLIPCYLEADLKKRLLWLLKLIKDEPIIKPISDCDILATDDELKQLLTTGKAYIKVKGKVAHDRIHCKSVLKSWPPGKRFESIYGKFSELTSNGDVGFSDLSSGETGTNIVFNVLKQRNRDKIYRTFETLMENSLTSNVSFEITVVDENQKVSQKSVDEMLLNTFNVFKKTNEVMLNHEIERIAGVINENELLLKIRPLLIKELSSGETSSEIIISNISKNFTDVDENTIKSLFDKHKINKLLTIKTDISSLHEKIKAYKINLTDIDNFVIAQYGDK